jgi:hypothetical protein
MVRLTPPRYAGDPLFAFGGKRVRKIFRYISSFQLNAIPLLRLAVERGDKRSDVGVSRLEFTESVG